MLQRQKPDRHEMELADTHDSGAEEWYCPTCGRRFLMQWPPNFKRIILESGDEEAVHTGGKGGVQATGAEAHDNTDGLQQWYPSEETNGAADHPHDGSSEDPGLSEEFLAAIDELDFTPLDVDDEEE